MESTTAQRDRAPCSDRRRQDGVHQTSPATRSSARPSATAGAGGGADERPGLPV